MQEGLWKRGRKKGSFIEQNERKCGNCAKPFLSGVIVVERGYTTRALCRACAHLHDEKGWENKDA